MIMLYGRRINNPGHGKYSGVFNFQGKDMEFPENAGKSSKFGSPLFRIADRLPKQRQLIGTKV